MTDIQTLTKEKISEQEKKLEYMNELKAQVTKLETRDHVISSFVSSDIVNELDIGKDPLKFAPRSLDKCVIFIDMHGYTTFSETHTTKQVHNTVNQYFEAINEVTYRNKGRVDKIIGDALLAFFGAPIDNPNHCLSAMNCALEIDDFCRKFRA